MCCTNFFSSQALREQIVPSARAYPLEALMADCQEYFRCARHACCAWGALCGAGWSDGPCSSRARGIRAGPPLAACAEPPRALPLNARLRAASQAQRAAGHV